MKKIYNSEKIYTVLITLLLFCVSYFIGLPEIIILSLSFLILLEIVRTIHDYIVNETHRIKIRYVIDSAILFGVRELFVGWVMLKSTGNFSMNSFNMPYSLLGLSIMVISLLSIGTLIFFRVKVIQSSPDVLEKD